MATRHGESRRGQPSHIYTIWSSMKTRCSNPKAENYPYYGGRGVSICREWQDSFEAFRDWAASNGFQDGLQLDREDNAENYTPENCRWVTMSENLRNTRFNVMLTFQGETKCVKAWSEDPRCVIPCRTLRNRLYRGWDTEKALTTPMMRNFERL